MKQAITLIATCLLVAIICAPADDKPALPELVLIKTSVETVHIPESFSQPEPDELGRANAVLITIPAEDITVTNYHIGLRDGTEILKIKKQ